MIQLFSGLGMNISVVDSVMLVLMYVQIIFGLITVVTYPHVFVSLHVYHMMIWMRWFPANIGLIVGRCFSHINCYKTQRNKVNNMKKFAKDNYNNNVEDTISNTERGSKTFWQFMGRFMGKSNSDTVIPPLKTQNGDYAFTDIEQASTFNDYF